MEKSECVFCKIRDKELPSKVLEETDDLLVIDNIAPKLPIHYLIIPKKHIKDINSLEQADTELAGKMLLMAQHLAKKFNVPYFRFIINNGPGAGQSVFHLHGHFLSGKQMNDF